MALDPSEERIFAKLDLLTERQTLTLVEIARMQEQIKSLPDQEGRLRSLERWRWTLVSGLGLLSTAFTIYSTNKGM